MTIAAGLPWLLAACSAMASPGAEPAGPADARGPRPSWRTFNIPLPTLGGRQLWADVAVYGGWRVQRHVWTGRCRLLDRHGIRRAAGPRAWCEAALAAARARGAARSRSRTLCLLVHGYLRSKDSMGGLRRGLERAGYEACAINYPSTRGHLDAFADQLREVLRYVSPDFEAVYIVTHSMGGIVARWALSREDFPKVRGLVMIAPPSRGTAMADKVFGWWPSRWVVGPAGREVGLGPRSRMAEVGMPRCPCAVIAGARGSRHGWNPLAPGDDDGLIALDETRLDGMADFVVLRAMHPFIMNDRETIRQTVAFIETGHFDHAAKPPAH